MVLDLSLGTDTSSKRSSDGTSNFTALEQAFDLDFVPDALEDTVSEFTALHASGSLLAESPTHEDIFEDAESEFTATF